MEATPTLALIVEVITTTAIITPEIATTIERLTAMTTSDSAHSNIILGYVFYGIYTMKY